MTQILSDEMMHHYSQVTDRVERGDGKVETRVCSRKEQNHSPGYKAMVAIPDAVKSGSVWVVRLLLAVPGVDINHEYARAPLMIAVRSQPPNIEMVKVILAVVGVKVQINEPQDREGNTVLNWADHNGCDEKIIQLLIDEGAQRIDEPLRSQVDVPQDGQIEGPLLRNAATLQALACGPFNFMSS
ncbi:hypothetical protein N7499_003420 [Penicillium canescens]|uniref:Ankyrin repeat protein n=1 Tax=Penicillium canescens TaxID=5083 RepID=A0AAD6N7A5_PENCN|nr:uncharacterized protein N7446_012347 [Penicillium canescens]KAJ6038073.1 hypothetical protein N7460_007844 [Penicillium canescens]KAJ6045483.1 hypothetical protein N7446_012347 [Penicillium canescens]KAJ6061164.1 hypothetical protein N7444_001860 [Penicillium canescens]KAJ6090706.1 hypothetical protein N7499_003420 [Penicillium canescens]KAJ6174890.1 hypothetical protein N7485_004695 [Penicillium canescens]